MFICSVKASRRRVLAVAAGVLVTAAVGVAVALPRGEQPVQAARDTAVDTAERVAFLERCGYTVDASAETVEEIRVPDEPDEVLLAYEALQEPAGMSLVRYCGKRVKRYTYTVKDTAARATLYVYRERVIAGDVTENDPAGEARGLTGVA